MSVTDFGALTAAQKKVWSTKLWMQYRAESFWQSNGFVGTNMNTPIHRVDELTKTSKGLECVMQLVNDLENDGTVGDNDLTNQEEAMVNGAQVIKIDLLAHAVKSKGQMSEQATVIRFREQAKDKLAFWLPDKIDELMFLTVSGRAYTKKTDLSTRAASQLPQLAFASDVSAPTANRIKYAGSATSEATLTTSDKLSWNLCVAVKTYAHRKGLRPIRQGGKEYYCMVISPEQRRDLVTDSDYKTIVANGAERGSSNPLFKNAMVVVDGLILYDHRKVITTQGLSSGVDKWGSGNTVEGAQAQLLGAGALGFTTLGGGEWLEGDINDYGRKPSIGYQQMFGLLKPVYKPTKSASAEDYGTIAVKTAAAV
ncbi:MAG: N4-gp56 family major capsid protein [Desulfurellales bacterium]|nr:MAG: N4-gp56 family major capsid protein [Desulfurellales bacterium]